MVPLTIGVGICTFFALNPEEIDVVTSGPLRAILGENITDKTIADKIYMEPLTLEKLAVRLNYSLPYISKRFKEDVGVSFVSYLQNYRVMQGCRLLSTTKHSLAEITEMEGYHDIKFFSELVKRITGLSPRDFRRRYRGG